MPHRHFHWPCWISQLRHRAKQKNTPLALLPGNIASHQPTMKLVTASLCQCHCIVSCVCGYTHSYSSIQIMTGQFNIGACAYVIALAQAHTYGVTLRT